MFRFIATTLYPNFPASYRSDYPLNEAVGRLRGSVETNGFYALLKESAVGKVSERHVRLQRVIPFFGNSFKPIFVGMFRQKAEGVFLEGKFTTFMYSKIFMTLWFGFASLWTIAAGSLPATRGIRGFAGSHRLRSVATSRRRSSDWM